MDGVQTRQERSDRQLISRLLEQEARELSFDEIEDMEQQLHELEVIDDFLRQIAPALAHAEDY